MAELKIENDRNNANLQELADITKRNLTELKLLLKDQVLTTEDFVIENIKAYPFRALGIALLTGILLGKCL